MPVLKYETFNKWTLAEKKEDGTYKFFESEFDTEAEAVEMMELGDFPVEVVVIRKEIQIRYKGEN